MRHTILTAVLALASGAVQAASPAPLANCPIERAVYKQAGNPETSAGFTHQRIKSSFATDLVFWIKSGKQQFWYEFSSPNGYGGTYISPQIDPRLVKANTDPDEPIDAQLRSAPESGGEDAKEQEPPSLMWDAFDANMKAYDGPPQKTNKAPARIFARELGPLFHYAHNGSLYKLSAPVRVDIAFWTLSACSPKAN